MAAPLLESLRRSPAGRLALAALVTLAAGTVLYAATAGDAAAPPKSAPANNPYAAWKHGPPADPAYFPIAVWLQDPAQAARYKAAGINLYVGLWEGPTEKQLAALKAAGMPVICDQNAVALKHKDDPTIVAWMHGDEPDNAQEIPGGKGYGPPIAPEKIVADYERLRAADPSRPVMLNLGQGVAWDAYIGRGARTNHPEDYAKYIQGCDIVSFDIYPVAHDSPAVRGKLEFVAQGVDRLIKWSGGRKVVWNCIECTRIQSDRKATPAQVKAEVWMALAGGSQGLIYFVHEWKPKFNEHALLDDPEMLAAVSGVNKAIQALAPALNSPAVADAAQVTPTPADVPIRAMTRRHDGATYIFAVALRGAAAKAAFTVPGLPQAAQAEVLGEGRSIKVSAGRFDDAFEPYGVHLYRIK
jgi:hypothetical protein